MVPSKNQLTDLIMEFLDGVKRLRQECGVPGNGPLTVVGQVTEMRRLVDWYAQALLEIHMEEEFWQFLRFPFSFNTLANSNVPYVVSSEAADAVMIEPVWSDTSTWEDSSVWSEAPYAAGNIDLEDFAAFRSDSFRIYLASGNRSDETFLGEYDYNTFRDVFLYGTQLTSYGRPHVVTQTQHDSLRLFHPPNDIYTVTGEYYKTPALLTLDDDDILLPRRFEMLPVYAAMMSYAVYEAAPEVYQRAEIGYNKLMNRMRMAEGPQISIGGSLI